MDTGIAQAEDSMPDSLEIPHIKMPKKVLTILITASSLMLIATDAKADGETWCKAGDPDDTYVNKRYPENGKVTGSINNGTDIWVNPSKTKTDSKGRRWTAVIRNDKSGSHDYILGKFTYDCKHCAGRSCKPVEIN